MIKTLFGILLSTLAVQASATAIISVTYDKLEVRNLAVIDFTDGSQSVFADTLSGGLLSGGASVNFNRTYTIEEENTVVSALADGTISSINHFNLEANSDVYPGGGVSQGAISDADAESEVTLTWEFSIQGNGALFEGGGFNELFTSPSATDTIAEIVLYDLTTSTTVLSVDAGFGFLADTTTLLDGHSYRLTAQALDSRDDDEDVDVFFSFDNATIIRTVPAPSSLGLLLLGFIVFVCSHKV